MTSTDTYLAPADRSDAPVLLTDQEPVRRERRAVSYCDIWDLVAPGEPCPTCEDSYADRLHKARRPRG